MSKGKLYICPTPIGNLEDITFRVIKVLSSVDLIAAEDTRHTLRLLNHFEIKNKLVSYHEHNRTTSGPQLIEKLLEGYQIALVSDAGMPGISDPGEDLVAACINNGIAVEALPGPSALITALAASGLSTRRFLFEGFLDRQKKNRKKRLEQLKSLEETLVFYESPHRLLESLSDIEKILGNRKIVLARELTKKFEEYYRGDVLKAIDYFKEKGIKGEFVVMLEGCQDVEEVGFDMTIEEHLMTLMNQGVSKKDAIQLVAQQRDIPKREVYNIGISMNTPPHS